LATPPTQKNGGCDRRRKKNKLCAIFDFELISHQVFPAKGFYRLKRLRLNVCMTDVLSSSCL
jgi:hypothetical protein